MKSVATMSLVSGEIGEMLGVKLAMDEHLIELFELLGWL